MTTDVLEPKEAPRERRSPAPDPPAALHGRLLNVSRMATIGEMAAGVAHELNQPLTAIANYAQACERLLARPDSDPADVREGLRQITAQATRAADIIRRLRDLAHSQRGERCLAAINALVTELRELIQTDALIHGVTLSFELTDGLPQVLVDTGQIQQVVLNFVRNSLEALSARPIGSRQIVIRTEATPERAVRLAVIDNGPGLPAETRQRLFDPFFSTKENGTGLGLAISNTIARSHGGSVGYQPMEPTGACFFILLPTEPGQ